jgi:hypothetical protein
MDLFEFPRFYPDFSEFCGDVFFWTYRIRQTLDLRSEMPFSSNVMEICSSMQGIAAKTWRLRSTSNAR